MFCWDFLLVGGGGLHSQSDLVILIDGVLNGDDAIVSARLSKLPIGERCMPVGEQSSRGVHLRTGTFPFANGLVREKNSFLFTLTFAQSRIS